MTVTVCFLGLPAYKLNKLQHIQNSAARLVTRWRIGRQADVNPVLKDLHWLPIKQRVRYKILAPNYLSELISINHPLHKTRKSVGIRLNPFSIKDHGKQPSKTYGDRAFSGYAPKLWNSLPLELRLLVLEKIAPFKKSLKTYI
ncbi:uncharacterized protein LOC144451316 [Glandiceps talaboti]